MKYQLFLLFLLTMCGRGAEPAHPPSKVENPVKESDLPVLKITALAEKRLGIVTADVVRKKVPSSRLFAGEIVLPLAVKDAADVITLAPLPPAAPEEFRRVATEQAAADGAIAASRAACEAADIAVQRAGQLARERAGSQRVLDEARAAAAQAAVALRTAEAQRALLGQPVAEAMASPRRWVRVAVASTELSRINLKAPAAVTVWSKAKAVPTTAAPLAMPPAAASLAGSVDVYFSLGEAQALRAGQRVQVSMELAGDDAESLVVPWSAVLYDALGGSWVYEQTAPQTYVHRRISVRRVAGDVAALDAGPPPGTKVVITGAAELFGAEFGGFK